MRKVFLDDLPRKEGFGANKGKSVIDWKNSANYKIRFLYDEIDNFIDIIEYKKGGILKIRYKNNSMNIRASEFSKCKIGYLLKKVTKDYKIDINQVFKDEKRDLVVFDRKKKQRYIESNEQEKGNFVNEKVYKYKCNKCGFNCGEYYKSGKYFKECWITEGSILSGVGCSCCSGLSTVLGINTIWDTDRWLCDLGVSEEDAKKYSKGTREEIVVMCPHCGRTKKKSVNKLYSNKSIGCPCSGGTSYPERFMFNLLNQLGVKFITQLSKKVFKWCGDYRYDFYLPDYNMVIETHGGQHYEEAKGFYKALEREKEIDELKEKLAKENGIKHYVVIDCRYSDLVWIRDGIMKTEIAREFDLCDIDWNDINIKSMTSNIVKEVCDYWNDKEEWETTKNLSNYFSMNQSLIINYLKKGSILNWCDYDPNRETLKSRKVRRNWSKRKIMVFKDGISIGVFESAAELERQSEQKFGVKMLHSSISQVCSGKRKHHKGFTFKYVD